MSHVGAFVSSMDVDRTLAVVAARQRGVVTAADARAHGITPKVVARRVARGLLVPMEPGVWRHSAAPETWEQRALAGCVTEGGWASHQTAAALWQLDGCQPGPIHVLTRRWKRRPNPSVRVHESTLIPPEDVTVLEGIPVTSRGRTIVDLAAVLPPARVERALDTHGVDPLEVWECAERLGGRGRPWVVTARRLAARRLEQGGVAPNLFERRLLGILERAGLPLPEAQVEIRRPDGSLLGRVDWLYRAGQAVLECDSFRWHGQWMRRRRDLRRDRELVSLGFVVLRFAWEDLDDESVVARDVAGALTRLSA